MAIYKPSELHRLGVKAKKGLSQNFLIDQNILEKICRAASIQKGDQILEIGPGPGALTESMLKKGAFIYAIEKDPDLADKLTRLEPMGLKVFCADALTYPLESFPQGLKVVANLPYHITTPLIARLIDKFPQISSLTVMVQREVGQRMVAEKNSAMYSSFTMFLSAYSTPHYCFTVKPNSFFPAPSVHSSVIHMPLKPFPFSFAEKEFFSMTRRAFNQRRKMIKTSLREMFDQREIEQALIEIGVLPTARPQELSLADFSALFQKLQGSSNPSKDQHEEADPFGKVD